MTTMTTPDTRPVQGDAIDLTTVPAAERQRAFDAAFDYRGDVTLTLADGQAIECYIFDRRTGATLRDCVVRVMLPGGGEKRTIPYESIRGIAFSGKDTAAGKTWEAWVRRYVEKRMAGEHAGIDAEKLD